MMQKEHTGVETLVVHGGAGTIDPASLTPALERRLRVGLATALAAGHRVLMQGGPAIDAVVAAVCFLEDDPLFNAGRGAVFTADGAQEMDAAVMDGATRRAGAVASVCGPRNPVRGARAVMQRSGHVLLAGDGAVAFCRANGVEMADDDYFYTESRWGALKRVLASSVAGDQDRASAVANDQDRHGTVGAVALDRWGDLAAATSTGGMTAKRHGRVGDTPLFGAGTWADATCAVSCTGHGETYIRAAAAHEISARMRHGNETLGAATAAVMAELAALRSNDSADFGAGVGGLIAVDRDGQVAMPFDTRGMYRGQAGADGVLWTAIHAEALVPTLVRR